MLDICTTDTIVDDMIRQAMAHPGFQDLLEASLKAAKAKAKNDLRPDLYAALEWPTSMDAYIAFLRGFARLIPRQSMDPAWADPGTDEQQEVYDRLCHFYWLINQPVGASGSVIVQNVPWFAEWLIAYANDWGSFLNTTESFDADVLHSFLHDSPKYRVQDSMINGRPNAPSGWLTFNQFFARELNPGLRPIASPQTNTIVSSPADCTFKAMYDIGPDSRIPEITIKKTHKHASIEDLLQGSAYATAFRNGTFVHCFLGPYSYHRFHTPVSGVVKECYAVQGLVYLDVNLSDGQFDAPDSSQGGYEFNQARGVITVDTGGSEFGDVGVVAIVPVGMCQVSSVNMTAVPGSKTLKGDEFGYFLFGGSDIIVLFQEGVAKSVSKNTAYRLYGSAMAECNLR